MKDGSAAGGRLSVILRAVATVVAVSLLLWLVDWRASLSVLAGIRPAYVLLLLLLSVAVIWVSCVRWRLFIRARGRDLPMSRLMLLYTVGYFFNNFTPGNVGGDVVRGAMLGRGTGNSADAFGSVFLERYTGFIGLCISVLLGLAANPGLPIPARVVFVAVGMSCGLLAAGSLILFPPAERMMLAIARAVLKGGAAGKAERFIGTVFSFRTRWRVLAKAVFWSLVYNLLAIVNTHAACLALGADVQFGHLAVLVPMVLMVSAVPLTLNAVGIMEGAFVYFLGLAGAGGEAALSVALVLRAKNLIVGLMGGVVAAWWRKRGVGAEQGE